MAKAVWPSRIGMVAWPWKVVSFERTGKSIRLTVSCVSCGTTRSIASGNLRGSVCGGCGSVCENGFEAKDFEMSFKEIAHVLGVSEAVVESDYRRAICKIRKMLVDRGFNASDASIEGLMPWRDGP